MRAFLNLISNSFYAATKRKTESAESDFEANLTVSTKNPGSAVEVRIRDNGNSVPAVAQEKMFKPVLHDQASRRRNGPWSFDDPRHYREATRWQN
jgi:nitrogen-specific signal transduction histidine kinase